jgi:acyl carrier protein phosphodiesterase
MRNSFLLLLLLFFLLIGCKKQNNADQIAQELCACMKPLMAVYEQANSLSEDDDLDAITNAMTKMEKTATESEQCADALDAKYGKLDDREDEIQAAMQRACPEILQKMNEIDNIE